MLFCLQHTKGVALSQDTKWQVTLVNNQVNLVNNEAEETEVEEAAEAEAEVGAFSNVLPLPTTTITPDQPLHHYQIRPTTETEQVLQACPLWNYHLQQQKQISRQPSRVLR